MVSVVDICNRALTNKLGAARITSLTDGTRESDAVNLAYPYVRDFVLKAHVWNCTVDRVALAPLVSTPAHTYDYEYQTPGDCVRVLEVDTDYDWVVEGEKILTDEGTVLNIRYQKTVTDPTCWGPMLVECIVTRLAYDICEEITQSSAKKKELADDFLRVLTAAKSMDSQEGSPSNLKEDSWVTARY